jgi:LCP family protein required for cell wall assembly
VDDKSMRMGNGNRPNPQIRPNGSPRPNRRSAKNARKRRKFALIVGTITGAYLIIAVAATMNLLARANGSFDVPYYIDPPEISAAVPSNQPRPPSPFADLQEEDPVGIFRAPQRTNVLILGIDNQNLADVIIAASFERDTGVIRSGSIPRDTFAEPSPEIMERIRATGSRPPSVFKLNAVWAFGRQDGAAITRDHLNQTLGINIHYYVRLNLSAFRDIVDLIGGVEIEVPRRMFWYDPHDRPPLRIDIPPGVHQMDGQMAEHFVRFAPILMGI